MKTVTQYQRRLKALGFYHGKIDGDRGPLTNDAIVAFKISIGYRARSFLGPLTMAALFANRKIDKKVVPTAWPVWLKLAMTHLGLREYKGTRHNDQIVKWWGLIRTAFRTDETPWCAGFVGGNFEECGIVSTRSAAARSYNWQAWGTVITEPCVGCVVVFWRGKRKGAYGHVGYVVGRDQHGNIMVLGGNQRDMVSVRPFDLKRVLSYHYPKGFALPAKIGLSTLPVVNSNGRLSTNEA